MSSWKGAQCAANWLRPRPAWARHRQSTSDGSFARARRATTFWSTSWPSPTARISVRSGNIDQVECHPTGWVGAAARPKRGTIGECPPVPVVTPGSQTAGTSGARNVAGSGAESDRRSEWSGWNWLRMTSERAGIGGSSTWGLRQRNFGGKSLPKTTKQVCGGGLPCPSTPVMRLLRRDPGIRAVSRCESRGYDWRGGNPPYHKAPTPPPVRVDCPVGFGRTLVATRGSRPIPPRLGWLRRTTNLGRYGIQRQLGHTHTYRSVAADV